MSGGERHEMLALLEKGFERMDGRFDVLAEQIHTQGTKIAVQENSCALHRREDDRRDRRISALTAALGIVDKEVSQVIAVPRTPWLERLSRHATQIASILALLAMLGAGLWWITSRLTHMEKAIQHVATDARR